MSTNPPTFSPTQSPTVASTIHIAPIVFLILLFTIICASLGLNVSDIVAQDEHDKQMKKQMEKQARNAKERKAKDTHNH